MMKMRAMILVVSLVALLGMASTATAASEIIPIRMYEVRGTVEDRANSEHPGWSASYTGAVTQEEGLYYYRGGVGSLSNGDTEEPINDGQQRFQAGIGTAIDLYFEADKYYSISEIRLFGGNPIERDGLFSNTLTGALTHLSVIGFDALTEETISALNRETTPQRLVSSFNPTYVDDYLSLTDFSLAAINELTLTDFISLDDSNQFTLSEIQVFGTLVELPTEEPDPNAPIPEPSTMILLGLGLVGMVAVNRKRFSERS